jgi:hypothetical protein
MPASRRFTAAPANFSPSHRLDFRPGSFAPGGTRRGIEGSVLQTGILVGEDGLPRIIRQLPVAGQGNYDGMGEAATDIESALPASRACPGGRARQLEHASEERGNPGAPCGTGCTTKGG